MKNIGHFDICKEMAIRNMDIRVSPLENVTNLRKVKTGTQVTIGVDGDVVAAIGLENKFIGGLMLIDRKQYFEIKAVLEARTLNPSTDENTSVRVQGRGR